MCIQNLKTLALIEAKKLVTKNLLGEKEKWTNKAMISSSSLILFNKIQQVIPNICTKFQNPRFSSSWEIFDKKKRVYTHTPTNWKDKNYVPPINFVYRGYSNVFKRCRQNDKQSRPISDCSAGSTPFTQKYLPKNFGSLWYMYSLDT